MKHTAPRCCVCGCYLALNPGPMCRHCDEQGRPEMAGLSEWTALCEYADDHSIELMGDIISGRKKMPKGAKTWVAG